RYGDERQKNYHWGDGRTYEWNSKFAQGAADGLQPALARVAMQHDVFHYDDRVINDQSDCCRETSEGHQVETFAQHLQHDEGDEDSYGKHRAGEAGRSPLAPGSDQAA